MNSTAMIHHARVMMGRSPELGSTAKVFSRLLFRLQAKGIITRKKRDISLTQEPLYQFFQIELQMIRLKALQGKGVSIQNRKSKIENWY